MKLLAVDIGGTFVKYGKYDCETNSLDSISKVPTPLTDQESLIHQVVNLSKKFPEVSGCAVSMPGTINSEKGYVSQGGSLQYNNETMFANELSKALLLPVTIENDARCAALAELWNGNLTGVKNALVVVLGTGLGCAIVQDGRIYRGHHQYAGEISIVFNKDINQYGFDAVLGNQFGIPKFVLKLSHLYGEPLSGSEAFHLIEEGNTALEEEFQQYVENLAIQLFNFQVMFDPEKILIGGGISGNKFFMKKLSKALEAFYRKLPILIKHEPIEKCKFGNDANLYGAVRHYNTVHKI